MVYRVLKTADAFSPNLSKGEVWFSIGMFSAIYLLLGTLYLYLVFKMVRQGPAPLPEKEA